MLPDLPPLDLALLSQLDAAGDVPAPGADDAALAFSGGTTPGRDTPRSTPHEANSRNAAEAQSDGGTRFDTGVRTPTIRDRVGDTPATPQPGAQPTHATGSAPLLPRDAAALEVIVRLRLASVRQIAALAFGGRNLTVARRRLRKLEAQGWISFWDRPSRFGAAVRYALPTRRAFAYIRPLFDALAAASKFGTLIRRMLPARARRLTAIAPGDVPPWIAHQDEINRLLVSIVATEDDRVAWYSSWDCPFPDRVNGLKAPQPDYVLVRETPAGIVVTFGEHDRATEPLARWSEKIAAYAVALELAREWLGIEGFTVDVSVLDPSSRDPIVRLRELIELANASGAASFMRFTLAGWLHAFPAQPVWFAHGTLPANGSRGRRDHLDRLVA